MKAAIYARVSTTEQAEEGYSIQAQINILKEYCTKNSIDIYDIYSDEGVSGQKENRPQFQRMLNDAEKKSFNIILVHKYDRFARKVELSQRIKNQLSKSSVNVISATEPIENSPMGFFVSGLHELMAEYYVRNLAQEVKKGMRERVKQGLHNGSVPYGYKIDKETGMMVINDGQAEVVKKIFEMYNDGNGSTVIARWLDRNHFETAIPGSRWDHYAVLRIIRNVKYIGYIQHAGEIYQGVHVPILDKATFDLAQNNRNDRLTKREPMGKNNLKFMLLGLLKCGVCGYKFMIRSRQETRTKNKDKWYNYYVCSRSKVHEYYDKCSHTKFYVADELEKIILEQYFEWLKDLEACTINQVEHNKLYESQISLAKRKIEKAEAAYLEDDMTRERYSEIRRQNLIIIAEVERKMSTEHKPLLIHQLTEKELLINEPSPAKRRLLMRRIVKEIIITPDKITFKSH